MQQLPPTTNPVLFVDDERANQVVFKASFRRNFDIRVATSAREAITILEETPIDVLVTDNRMPGMSGVELCGIVARTHPWVPRILVTGYSELEAAVDAINEGGVSRYLAKPWNPDELRSIIREAQLTAQHHRLALRLQEEMLRSERSSALAALRGEVLHDLANATSQLGMCSADLSAMADRLKAALPDDLAEAVGQEIHDLGIAVAYLTGLHTRVRALHRPATGSEDGVQLSDVVHGAAVLARPALPAGATLDIECEDAFRVKGDRTDLGRVLLNLMRNAAHALALAKVAAGRVRVTAYHEGSHVFVRVADNGPGVPSELRDRIFEHGFSTKGDQGDGLGLAISRQLAEAHGGNLELETTTTGASFRLTLCAETSTQKDEACVA